MKEQDLEELGFEKITVHEEVIKDDLRIPSFYYYIYQFEDKGSPLDLISPASDEVEKGNWKVFIYEAFNVEFTTKKDVKTYIDVIAKNRI